MSKISPRIRSHDVTDVLEDYRTEHHVVAFRRTKYAINALRGFFSGRKVGDISIPMCREYIAFRMDQGVAMSTVARELTVLRAACNHAIKWKRLPADQMPSFEIPADLPKREVWLFKDEVKRLMTAADGSLKAFITIAYFTASRRRAVETLEWYQVDFSRRTINLAKRGEVKTTKRRPVVPMGDLYPVLKDLYYSRTNEWVLGSDRDLLYDFTRLCESVDLLNVSERESRPAGKITPHILRHSRATHLLEDGVSIYAVAKLLGDSILTVEKTYGHISMGSLEDEINKSSL